MPDRRYALLGHVHAAAAAAAWGTITGTLSAQTDLQAALDAKASATNEANWDTAYGWGDHASTYEPLDAEIMRADTTDTTSVIFTHTLQQAMRRGISGNYSSTSGSGSWGADIWSLDTSWQGSTAGPNSAKNVVHYGPRWLRASHTEATGSIGEGLYVYKAGTEFVSIGEGGMNLAGDFFLGGDIDMGTNTMTDTSLGQFATAYGWGDHASAGYAVGTDLVHGAQVQNSAGSAQIYFEGESANVWRMGSSGAAGDDFILFNETLSTCFTVDDTTGDFTVHNDLAVTGAYSGGNVANWDTAYGWGDHASTYLPLAGGALTGDVTIAGKTHATGTEVARWAFTGDADFLKLTMTAGAAAFNTTSITNITWTGATRFRLEGGMTFAQKEGNSSASDVAGYGQWWVRNDTPCIPMFTDDAGTDWDLLTAAGGPATETKYKATDEVRSATSTTLTIDADMTGYALDADSYYKVEGYFNASSSDTVADFKAQLTFTQAPQDSWWTLEAANSSGSGTDADHNQHSTAVVLNWTQSGNWGIHVKGYIQSNATTGGTVAVYWAKNALAAGQNTTLKEGTWLTITKLS